MARAKAIEINPQATADAPPEEAGGEGSESLFDASGDARVRILRRDERTQKMVTHGYMEPTVSEEMVSARFGGGHYRAQLFVPDDSGVPKVKRSRDFDIPGPYKPPTKINTMDEVGPNAPLPQQSGNGATTIAVGGGDDLMQVLKAGIINTLLEMMKSTKEMRGAPAGPDPMLLKLMETQAATQTKMMEFMLTLATKDSGGDRKEIVKEMLQMKELFAPPANTGNVPANPMEMFNNMLDTFKSFREAAEDVAPKAASGDPLMDSIPKLVEVVAEQHALNKQQRANAAPRPAPTHTPAVQTLPMPDTPLWKQLLRQQGNRLVASAVAAHDPDVIAGTAILFAPPHIKAALAEFFHREETEVTADILVEVPALAQHTTWLTEFVNAAQYRLFPEEFSEDDDAKEETEETPESAA